MNKDLKKKWIKALLSGKYKQGQYRLYEDNKYCCLGVLCKISNLGHFDSEGNYVNKKGKCIWVKNSHTPSMHKNKFAIDEIMGETLIRMNDGYFYCPEKYSGVKNFKTIAKFISEEF